MQPFAQIFRKLVKLVAAVDLDGFPGSAESDLAMPAAAEMLFKVRAQRHGGGLIEHFIQLG